MRAAVDGGMGSSRCERVADTIGAISSINVRGRIFARIRKVREIPICLVKALTLNRLPGNRQDVSETDKKSRR